MAPSYWLKGYETQNFGDFLSEFLFSKLSDGLRVRADAYYLIGSVISGDFIKTHESSTEDCELAKVVFWCCGARDGTKPINGCLVNADIRGVRGPLTRNLLNLPNDTVIGDSALLLPIIHTPAVIAECTGKSVCVPHYLDEMNDEGLRDITGADLVIRPRLSNDVSEIPKFIDRIASAEFVLAGALHAAIVACAYGVPFAYFDNGFLDTPFKWRDFSGSIGVGTYFVKTVKDGRSVYEHMIRPSLSKPYLFPMLAIAPFTPKIQCLYSAALMDASREGDAPGRQLNLDAFNAMVEEIQSVEPMLQLEQVRFKLNEAESILQRQLGKMEDDKKIINTLRERVSYLGREISQRDAKIRLQEQEIERMSARVDLRNDLDIRKGEGIISEGRRVNNKLVNIFEKVIGKRNRRN